MLKLVLLFSVIGMANVVLASDLTIKVTTASHQNMPNAVVYLMTEDSVQHESTVVEPMALMDQINKQFAPHILAVQKGTQVRFPNSDSIKHHVYSFSRALTFELQLYKGLEAEPLLFNHSGIIELGCNVHDWMLGYIIVVDTPYFGKTNAKGEMRFDVPDGQYKVKIWHPRIDENLTDLEKSISLTSQSTELIQLTKKLLPDLNQYETLPSDFEQYD